MQTLLLNGILITELLCIIPTKAIGQERQDNSNPTSLEYYTFPKDTLVCTPNDYIIQRVRQHWQVFFVEELVLISRLSLFCFNSDKTQFVEQVAIADSAIPPRYGTIHLLVTSFDTRFKSADLATRAIDQGN